LSKPSDDLATLFLQYNSLADIWIRLLPLSPGRSLFELTTHGTAPEFIPSEEISENWRGTTGRGSWYWMVICSWAAEFTLMALSPEKQSYLSDKIRGQQIGEELQEEEDGSGWCFVRGLSDKIKEARKLERNYRKRKLVVDGDLFVGCRDHLHRLITAEKQSYISDKTVDSFLIKKPTIRLPDHNSLEELVCQFNQFFEEKTADIRARLDATYTNNPTQEEARTVPTFSCFSPVSESDIADLSEVSQLSHVLLILFLLIF